MAPFLDPTLRGDNGDVGIIRSPVRAIVLPDNSTSLYWFPVGHPPFMCRVAEPTFLRSSVSSHCRGCPKPQGQQRGNCNSSQFQMRTLRYSLRRVSPLDSVNGGTHNPKVGGSNPPPATILSITCPPSPLEFGTI